MNAFDTVIVLDSSADAAAAKELPRTIVPLKIITSEKEYTDNERLDVGAMIADLRAYSGKSSTSCPNPQEFLAAFGEAKHVFCITITGSLSGSHNAALAAAHEYTAKHPERRVCVFDSLSTGPELLIVADVIEKAVADGKDFDEVSEILDGYKNHRKTGLIFMLESLQNLANNGRVSHVAAKAASVLGIRVVGKASDEGTLEQLEKCLGGKKALKSIVANMKLQGYAGGEARIAHCNNADAAASLQKLLLSEFPEAKTEVHPCGGLCSFYAEEGGLLVGFTKGTN
jgi:DegV family protein with EDD domain